VGGFGYQTPLNHCLSTLILTLTDNHNELTCKQFCNYKTNEHFPWGNEISSADVSLPLLLVWTIQLLLRSKALHSLRLSLRPFNAVVRKQSHDRRHELVTMCTVCSDEMCFPADNKSFRIYVHRNDVLPKVAGKRICA